MLKYIGIGAALLIGGVLVLAAMRPDSFQIRRSATIHAAPERIFPLINDLHRFNTWNPFDKPEMTGSYSGPQSGKGAAYAFGSGMIEITDSAPASSVTMALRMMQPFEVRNTVEFSLRPASSAATEVAWTMHGPVPYVAKIIHLFIDMDRMVGAEFDAGLASLKTLAEKAR